jgi:putative lipoprotein
MLFERFLTFPLLATIALVGCSETEAPAAPEVETETEMAVLKGEAFYRERIALPPRATLIVRLEDVSRMDVASTVLAEYTEELDSPPPYPFELEYDPSVIDERMSYNVRATIKAGEKRVFMSTESIDPFDLGDEPLRVMMTSMGGSPDRATAQVAPDRDMRMIVSRNPLVPLEGTRWKLVSLGGVDVTQPDDPERQAYFILNAEEDRALGSGSCNSFTGGYETNGNELSFGALASTRKMCMDHMELEAGLFAALEAVTWFSIQERKLVLLGEDKMPLAVFDAVE